MIFRSMFHNPTESRKGVDLSRKYETQYKLVRPYSKDENGKVINQTPFNRLVEVGKIDIEESIQSYAESTDFGKIIEKYVLSGYDERLVDVRAGQYLDISNIPDNINDFNEYFDSLKFENYSKELKDAIVNNPDNLDNAINAEIDKILLSKYGISRAAAVGDTETKDGEK